MPHGSSRHGLGFAAHTRHSSGCMNSQSYARGFLMAPPAHTANMLRGIGTAMLSHLALSAI